MYDKHEKVGFSTIFGSEKGGVSRDSGFVLKAIDSTKKGYREDEGVIEERESLASPPNYETAISNDAQPEMNNPEASKLMA